MGPSWVKWEVVEVEHPLLKLLTGELTPTEGTITRHPHLSIAKYHQHSVEVNYSVLRQWLETDG